MRFNNLLSVLRHVRCKTTLVNHKNDLNPSIFIKNFKRRFIFDSYFDLEDDYKRLSRSSKVSYYAIGLFLLIPSGLALLSPSTPAYVNLLSHHFKVSSLTLSWISSNYFAFHIGNFGNNSFLANSRYIYHTLPSFRSIIGVAFSLIGVTGTLIVGDHSLISGLYGLICCYALLGLYNYALTVNKLLPRCIFIPSNSLILLNLATTIASLIKSYHIKKGLSISDEEIIRRFESSNKFKKFEIKN